jgi:phospholipid/cholesterol/gamma-HCH transport system substrate-binding protein
MTRINASANGSSSPRVLAVALVALLGIAAGLTGLAREDDAEQLFVNAKFDDVSPLLTGSDIKLHGVPVGEVAAVEVADDNRALVSMRLETDALPVHRDARLTVRPVSLLGERFLDLDPGSPTSPVLQQGDMIPASQTGQAVDLDQVLNMMNKPTGEGMSAFITMLGQGMAGNGENADQAIRVLAESMDDTGKFVHVLRRHTDLLTSLVDRIRPVTQAMAANEGRNLDSLLDSALRLTAATSSRNEELQETISELPPTLAQGRRSLTQLDATAAESTKTLAEMRPMTEQLAALGGQLSRFAQAADPALARTEPVLAHAAHMMRQLRPVAEQLRKAGPDIRSVTENGEPVVSEIGRHFDDLFDFIRNWALTTNGYDGLSHYYRAQVVIEDPGLEDGSHTSARNSQPGLTEPLEQPGLPELPELLRQPGQPGVPSPPGGLLEPEDGRGGVTGLTPRQEQRATEFLLGGGQ